MLLGFCFLGVVFPADYCGMTSQSKAEVIASAVVRIMLKVRGIFMHFTEVHGP